jgi:hypothetical protein
MWLCEIWINWQILLVIVKPETVIAFVSRAWALMDFGDGAYRKISN